MRIIWICGFSNAEVRERLKIRRNPLESYVMKLVHRTEDLGSDVGIWISNGITEMKKRNDIELHIISLVRDLVQKRQDFKSEGIHYHFIREEDSGLYRKVKRYLFGRNSSVFLQNRENIINLINEINPDLVHVIGAENPYYSLALLDIPKTIPTILQLQALLVSLQGKASEKDSANFAYKGEWEKKLIQRADYVGTCVQSYIQYIRKYIKSDTKFVKTTLAMAQHIDLSKNKKEFTFVHFAAQLCATKATDIALKAFSIAHRSHPEITLDCIGIYLDDFKSELDQLIEENNLKDAVIFEGRLPTHDDVIRQIRKAQFSLLPLKTDIIPNTIHESIANGLPVITTETEDGTPSLNSKRQTVLISPPGDYEDLASKMIFLLDHPEKAEELRQNAAVTEAEFANNHDIINRWVEVYDAILKQNKYGTEIPAEYLW